MCLMPIDISAALIPRESHWRETYALSEEHPMVPLMKVRSSLCVGEERSKQERFSRSLKHAALLRRVGLVLMCAVIGLRRMCCIGVEELMDDGKVCICLFGMGIVGSVGSHQSLAQGWCLVRQPSHRIDRR